MNLEEYLADCDRRYSDQHHMLGLAWKGPGYHTRIADGTWAHPIRESLDYALGLLRSGEPSRAERAAAIIRKVLTLQETTPTERTYGIWPWLMEEPLSRMDPPDWNWADFCGARLAQILVDHAGALPDDLRRETRASLGHAAWSIFRRNVQPGYTNIAIMGAGVALAAGELLDEPRLLDYGRRRLRAIVEHTAYHGGFNEYNSPTYTTVALHECERILQLVRDPAARADAEPLRRVAWQTIAEHYHPGTAQWAGPHSRAYGEWLPAEVAGYLSEQTGVEVRPHPAAPQSKTGLTHIRPLPCPPQLVDRFQALPHDVVEVRRRFIRRDTEERSTWGTTWLAGDACLGSVNHDNMWTQRHVVLGYWQTDDDPAVLLRLRFLHDGRDFASAYVRNAQQGPRVLSVVSLLTNKGDFHDHLDRPADGVFEAEDFRLRYELIGMGVTGKPVGADRFELAAGSRRAVIHTLPGHFGPHQLAWELGRDEGQAYLDGICYYGPRRRFDFTEFGDLMIAAGLELLEADQLPAEASLKAGEPREDIYEVTWPAADGLRLTGPVRAGPYL